MDELKSLLCRIENAATDIACAEHALKGYAASPRLGVRAERVCRSLQPSVQDTQSYQGDGDRAGKLNKPRGCAMKMHSSITVERVVEAAKEQMFGMENPGFCVECGEDADGCEPDAREYPCEVCGEEAVYGAEELLLYLVA